MDLRAPSRRSRLLSMKIIVAITNDKFRSGSDDFLKTTVTGVIFRLANNSVTLDDVVHVRARHQARHPETAGADVAF